MPSFITGLQDLKSQADAADPKYHVAVRERDRRCLGPEKHIEDALNAMVARS